MNETVVWRTIWTTGAITAGIAFTCVDLAREKNDIAAGRTHSTGTTFSATNRWWIERLGPLGPAVFSAGLDAIRDWYEPHILKPRQAPQRAGNPMGGTA